MTLQEKIEYIEKHIPRIDAVRTMKVSRYKYNRARLGIENPSVKFITRLDYVYTKIYNEVSKEEIEEFHIFMRNKLKQKEHDEMMKAKLIKNYDDEDLGDLKTYNSSHGVNKGSRAYNPHSN